MSRATNVGRPFRPILPKLLLYAAGCFATWVGRQGVCWRFDCE